jgi:hypothetical protein
MWNSFLTPLKKACSEARPRADFRTRGRLRELFSVNSFFVTNAPFCHDMAFVLYCWRSLVGKRAPTPRLIDEFWYVNFTYANR